MFVLAGRNDLEHTKKSRKLHVVSFCVSICSSPEETEKIGTEEYNFFWK